MPPALFVLVIFEIGSLLYACAALDYDPPIYASCMAKVTGSHYHTQHFTGEIGSQELFAQAGIKLQSS
jgi:hypothetical protein